MERGQRRGATQGIATETSHLARLIEEGIKHKGFSFISVLTPCSTFHHAGLFESIKAQASYLETGKPVELPALSGEKSWIHDPSDINLALRLAEGPITEKPYLGVFYRGSTE